MSDTALSCAREHLLPCARDHVLPYLKVAARMIMGLPKDVAEMKDELERIQAFIHHADTMDADEDDNSPDGIKRRMKQLIEISFRMEDVIDEYMVTLEQQTHNDTAGCAALCESAVDYIKTMIPRLLIANKMKDINSRVREMKERYGPSYGFQLQAPLVQGPSGSGGNKNIPKWQKRREDPLYEDQSEIVGFEDPKKQLVSWMVEGRKERTVISVVGMGGQGKTTLAKKVFDNEDVARLFGCRVWITVSQSYDIVGLLRDMLQKICKEKKKDIPQNVSTMDQRSLIEEVKNHLHQERYVVLFDDVLADSFWDDIESAVIDNKIGSRILITTRHMKVAKSFKKSSFVQIQELRLLSSEESWTLFSQKAFHFDCDGKCPEELEDISFEIVKKCGGLPLALVVIGGLLSCTDKTGDEWKKFSGNLLSKQNNQELVDIRKILSLSYNALPCYLKSCFLYFGIYPEDYEIKCKRLIRQWIAEGFVKDKAEETLEEVAKQYLKELINRNLVQVSSLSIYGKVTSCRVHDLTRDMILGKFKDLCFCQNIHDKSVLSEITRRLSIMSSSNGLMSSSESSHIRSLFVFTQKELSEHFLRKMPTHYMLLTVLDFENCKMSFVPENLGNLIQLKYLSFRHTEVESLPNSISKLQNLETLDIRGTRVEKMPTEFCKLKTLRHLRLQYRLSNKGMDGIGGMTSLQTLTGVKIEEDGVELIRELGRLTELRKLSLDDVREEQGSALWSSINNMQHLESLRVYSKYEHDLLGSQVHSISLPSLRKLLLWSYSVKLPDWILNHQNLVKLTLINFHLTDDPMQSLKDLPNLLYLCLSSSYKGVSLHFQDGGFQKLKELKLHYLENLNSIYIDERGLPFLKTLWLISIPKLEMVPSGIQYLKELEVLHVQLMSTEFEENIAPIGGPKHSAIQHVPLVKIFTDHAERHTIHPSRRYQS